MKNGRINILVLLYCYLLFGAPASAESTSTLEFLEIFPTAGEVTAVAAAGDTVFVSDFSSGILILDTSTSPTTLIGQIGDSFVTRNLFLKDDLLYFIQFLEGLKIYDVSIPSSPTLIGQFDLGVNPGFNKPIFIDSGRLAFLMDRGGAGGSPQTIGILDVNDPTSPTFLGSVAAPGIQLQDVIIDDDILYSFTGTFGAVGLIRVFNIADLDNPQEIFRGTSSLMSHAVLSDNHLFISASDSLLILDASDPTSLTFVSRILTPGMGTDECVLQGDLIFTIVQNNEKNSKEIHVISIEDLVNPVFVEKISAPTILVNLVIEKDRLYGGYFNGSLLIYKIKNRIQIAKIQKIILGKDDFPITLTQEEDANQDSLIDVSDILQILN